ncbi:MAG: GNAT family N-acetyltransferase [Granulosicoccus sp.]
MSVYNHLGQQCYVVHVSVCDGASSNQIMSVTMRQFPDNVFDSHHPAQLKQGEWKSDAGFLEALRVSWLGQYADYIGFEKAADYIEQLRAQGRLYDHHEPLTIHAWINGRIVGISALRPLPGIDLITMLEVHPDFRSRGIGKQLLLALCNASDRLMAHVSIHQPRVKEFYKRSGFHVLDRSEERHGDHMLMFDVLAKSISRHVS